MKTLNNLPKSSNQPITFIRVPHYFSRRTDISPAIKLIVAHIHTRSRIKIPSGQRLEWEVNAQEIANNSGINKMGVSRVIKTLTQAGVLIYKGTIQYHGQWPSKTYAIDRIKLKDYMKKPVTPCYRTGNTMLLPPVTFDGGPAVTPCYLEEDPEKEDPEKEVRNKKVLVHTFGDKSPVGKHQGANAPATALSGKHQGANACGSPNRPNIQSVTDAAAVSGKYQGANPPADGSLSARLGAVQRSADEPLDVWAMLDEIPTIAQNEMAAALDYRTAHANRFKEGI